MTMLFDRFFELVEQGRIKSVVFDRHPFDPTFEILADGEPVTIEEGKRTPLAFQDLDKFLADLQRRGLYEVRLVFNPGVVLGGD